MHAEWLGQRFIGRRSGLGLCALLALGCGTCEEAPKPAEPAPAPTPPPTQDEALYIPDEEEVEAVVGEPDKPEPETKSVAKKRPRKPKSRVCDGTITAKDARAVIARASPRVRQCYERRLRVNNILQGELRVEVEVGSDGRVDHVRIGGTLRDDQVRKCVKSLAKGWRFPSPSGGACSVVVAPFNLEPAGA